MAVFAATTATLTRAQLLSERQAHDEIVRAVSEQLAKPDRFTRLPSNLSGLSVTPDRKPIFSIVFGGKPEEFKPQAGNQAYLKDEGRFFVTRFGTVVAAYKDQVVLQGQLKAGQSTLVMCGPSTARRVDFPGRLSISRVFRAGSDWGFIFNDGLNTSIKLDSSTNLQTTLSNRVFAPWVVETGTGAIVATRPDDSTGNDPNSHLGIAVKDERGLKQSLFRGYHRLGRELQAVLPLNDGRFLAVSEKIIALREDGPTDLTDAEIGALTNAFEKLDQAKFSEALRVVSEHSNEQLRAGKLWLLVPRDPLEAFQNVERATRYLFESMTNAEPRLKAVTNREPLVASFNRYREAAREFQRRLEQERDRPFGVSLAHAFELMRDGWQFFAGHWVRHPQVLQQDGAETILLELEFMDAEWKPARGVFRLDPEARLGLLFQHERDSVTPPCQFFRTAVGEQLVFFPFEGLARYGRGTLEWLDRSDEMKWLERVIGCDREGWIYFRSRPSIAFPNTSGLVQRTSSGYEIWATCRLGSPDFWVYRPMARPTNSPIVRLFPVAHTPVMDRHNRIWFCPAIPPGFAVPPAVGSLMRTRSAELALAELAAATQRPMPINPLSEPLARMFGAAEIDAQLDLFCYEDGRVSLCLTNLPLSTVLLAGEADTVIGTTQGRSDRSAFVVENGQSATLGSDLHDLAINAFSLLSRAAPRQSEPTGFAYFNHIVHPTDYSPSLCLVGDRLWINDHDKVEVYQNGKSLGFQMKLTIPSSTLALLGPVTNSMGDPRMLIFRPTIAEGFSSMACASLSWAAASGEGESFGVDRVTTTPTWDTPVFNRAKGTFYLAAAVNRCWEVSGLKELKRLDNVGAPVLALHNGDWIGRGAGYAGYRLVSGKQLWDVTVACSRQFEILAEVEPGRLMCATPEGLLWLARVREGEFKVSGELHLHTGGFAVSFVGEDAKNLYLTLSDARRQAYLAVVEKPQSSP